MRAQGPGLGPIGPLIDKKKIELASILCFYIMHITFFVGSRTKRAEDVSHTYNICFHLLVLNYVKYLLFDVCGGGGVIHQSWTVKMELKNNALQNE